MTNPVSYIRQSLAQRISVGILIGMLVVFVVAIGWVAVKSKEKVRKEAYQRAVRLLDNISLRVINYLDEAEVATHNFYWQAQANMQPDSLLAYSRRVVELNPHVNSCSITTEPDFFPQLGRYFSAYSVRKGDSIETVREAEYEYFEKVWYKTPREVGKAVWVDPFDDYNEGTLSSEVMIASYCDPLYSSDGRIIGVFSTDISLPLLSEAITAEKPYPDSYTLMLGKDGRYFVHPEADRLVKTTIFDEVDPLLQPGLIALGHEMLAGKSGVLDVTANGVTYICFYRPIPQAGWSIALVCTEDDIFVSYNRLTYFVVPLVLIGLLLMLYFCRRTVTRFIAPLEQLSGQARRIADGHFDEHMPSTERPDVIGRLQNNFATMQATLDDHVGRLQAINAESEQRNQELSQASQNAIEALRQKSAFLQDMSHQIRTPLNIIMGFAQVLRDNYGHIPENEIKEISDTMLKNTISVSHMVNKLMAAATIIDKKEKVKRHDIINVNEFAQSVVDIFRMNYGVLFDKTFILTIDSDLPATMNIFTNRDILTKILAELLDNALKYTTGDTVTLRVRGGARIVRFMVEDNGPGIPEESRDSVFMQFEKLDDFGEGLGLGLSISKQFSVLLGGDLYLDTTYTSGSRFVLEVPRDEK